MDGWIDDIQQPGRAQRVINKRTATTTTKHPTSSFFFLGGGAEEGGRREIGGGGQHQKMSTQSSGSHRMTVRRKKTKRAQLTREEVNIFNSFVKKTCPLQCFVREKTGDSSLTSLLSLLLLFFLHRDGGFSKKKFILFLYKRKFDNEYV